MLPFLDKDRAVGLIVSKRGNKEMEVAPEVKAPGSELDPGLEAAAEDLLRAINEKSVLGIAHALKSAWEICESYEDESGDIE